MTVPLFEQNRLLPPFHSLFSYAHSSCVSLEDFALEKIRSMFTRLFLLQHVCPEDGIVYSFSILKREVF